MAEGGHPPPPPPYSRYDPLTYDQGTVATSSSESGDSVTDQLEGLHLDASSYVTGQEVANLLPKAPMQDIKNAHDDENAVCGKAPNDSSDVGIMRTTVKNDHDIENECDDLNIHRDYTDNFHGLGMISKIRQQGTRANKAINRRVQELCDQIQTGKCLVKSNHQHSVAGFSQTPLNRVQFLPSDLEYVSKSILGSFCLWPSDVVHRSLHQYLRSTGEHRYSPSVPFCCYIAPCTPSFIIEASPLRGLVLVDDEGQRKQVGRDKCVYLGCATSHTKKDLLYCLDATGRSILQYRVRSRHKDLKLLNETQSTDVGSLSGMDCSSLTGFLVVIRDDKFITIEHPNGVQFYTVNRVEGGEQVFGSLWEICWGPDGATSVFVTDEGDGDVLPSVSCVELYPPKVKWRVLMTHPENIWCENGLVFVVTRLPSSVKVLSPHDGSLLTEIKCSGVPCGIGKDGDGRIVIVSYKNPLEEW